MNAVAKIGGERFGGIVGLLLGVVLVLSVVCYGGPTLTTIAQFNGTNGGFPLGELVMGANGNIFGTTAVGGNDFVNLNQIGYGTVFELSGSAHTLSTVASFDNTDGNQPTEIYLDSTGNIFGTTVNGGTAGRGTIFEIAVGTDAISDLFTFSGANGDGPAGGVFPGPSGIFYGATFGGGTSYQGVNNTGCGTLFMFNSATRQLNTLFSFTGSNGCAPATFIQDGAGNWFGSTVEGGPGYVSGNNLSGDGTVYEFNPTSSSFKTLADLDGLNGDEINAGLVMDSSGNIYGTTNAGGTYNLGVLFEVAANTHLVTTIINFNGPNGASPSGRLNMDAAGNLYGVTSNGGPDEALGSSGGYGTVYEVNGTTHVLTTLASFDNTDDEYVGAGLMADAQGNLYGTTESGGDGGYGTVYEITNSGYVVSVPEPVSLGVGMGLGLGLLMFSRSLLRGRNSLS